MCDDSDYEDFGLIKEDAVGGGCIVLAGKDDSEEEIIFIDSNKCSIACQTDTANFAIPNCPSIPNVPIFFCAQPLPCIVTTQCSIPHLVDIGVGTSSSKTCSRTYDEKEQHPDKSDAISSSSLLIQETESKWNYKLYFHFSVSHSL